MLPADNARSSARRRGHRQPRRSTDQRFNVSSEARRLTYLYAIVPADAPDPEAGLVGLDGGDVRLIRTGAVALVVSDVSSEVYEDEALNGRLDDLGWVGARGFEHERVVDWYAERGPVIPLSLFSLHENDQRAESRVAAGADEYLRLLDRLRGRKEWGIKLWRREQASREAIDRVSRSLTELASALESAPPGKRFLLQRKQEAMRADELRALSKRLAHETYSALASVAEASRLVPLPTNVPVGERALLLHAAFLVRDDAFPRFQEEVNRAAHGMAEAGFEIEFTGPWPPYHFSAPSDD